jgi:hypothetical protein
MKRIVVAVGLMMLLFAVSAVAQTPAPKPGPEHKKLDIWVGEWTCESEDQATPFNSAGKSTAKGSVKSILGGFFVEWRMEVSGPGGTMQNVEIDGYDPTTKKFTWHFFASDGSIQTVAYTIEGNKTAYTGTQALGAKEAKMRGTVVFAPDLMSFVEKREMSFDSKTWMPVFDSKCTKVKSSPK